MAAKKRFDTAKMRRRFLNSRTSLRKLAEEFGCSYRLVSGLSSKEGWFAKRQELEDQQEAAATQALADRVASKSAELAELKAVTVEQHVQRSLQTGEQLHMLLQQGLSALEAQDTRALKATIESWVTLDNQMRKIHKVDEASSKPLININVMAALPRMRTTAEV